MNYPGDSVVLLLPVERADGSLPGVTVAPTLLVMDAATGVPTGGPALTMTVIAGTKLIYSCAVATLGFPIGTYLAVVSYAVDGAVFQNKFLASFQLGDSNITGPVALNSTVAKEATVAKDLTVMHLNDFVSPDQSPIVQQMSVKISAWPAAIPSSTDQAAVLSAVTDIRDCSLGSWSVNKTTNVMTFYRLNGAKLASFQLQNSANQTLRMQL